MAEDNQPQLILIDNLRIDTGRITHYTWEGANPESAFHEEHKDDYTFDLVRGKLHRYLEVAMFHPFVDEFYSNVTGPWEKKFKDENARLAEELCGEEVVFSTPRPIIEKMVLYEGEYDYNSQDRMGVVKVTCGYEPRASNFRLVPLREGEYRTLEEGTYSEIEKALKDGLEDHLTKDPNFGRELGYRKKALRWLNCFGSFVQNDFVDISDIPIEVFPRYKEVPLRDLPGRGVHVLNEVTGNSYWHRKDPYYKNS